MTLKLVPHQITEFGETTKDAMAKAMERLSNEYDTTQGCQALFWVGIDGQTRLPVCRVTYLAEET